MALCQLWHEPDGRGGQIRTDDLLLPKQARYRATLHPERITIGEVRLEPEFLSSNTCGEGGIRTLGTVTRTTV